MRKAVIDMGTNSTRLAVGEALDGAFQMIYTEVAETRLGEGMGDERMLRPLYQAVPGAPANALHLNSH